MIESGKILCPKHRFYYKGAVCPFCENERLVKIASKFTEPTAKPEPDHKPAPAKKELVTAPVTDDMLNALKAKFNSK